MAIESPSKKPTPDRQHPFTGGLGEQYHATLAGWVGDRYRQDILDVNLGEFDRCLDSHVFLTP
jgi:hypothetical protein